MNPGWLAGPAWPSLLGEAWSTGCPAYLPGLSGSGDGREFATVALRGSSPCLMATALEERFLEACKSGDLATVQAALAQGCNVNSSEGWGLRRAVRYHHCDIWQALLSHPDIQVRNETNSDIWRRKTLELL